MKSERDRMLWIYKKCDKRREREIKKKKNVCVAWNQCNANEWTRKANRCKLFATNIQMITCTFHCLSLPFSLSRTLEYISNFQINVNISTNFQIITTITLQEQILVMQSHILNTLVEKPFQLEHVIRHIRYIESDVGVYTWNLPLIGWNWSRAIKIFSTFSAAYRSTNRKSTEHILNEKKTFRHSFLLGAIPCKDRI